MENYTHEDEEFKLVWFCENVETIQKLIPEFKFWEVEIFNLC